MTFNCDAGQVADSRFLLCDVEVNAERAAVLAAIGDSITDGDQSTVDGNARWPDALAARLQADPARRSVAVINAGIAGNRLLHDGPVGPSALARFDRDVLKKSGVKWVLLLEGINDIGMSGSPPGDVTAEQIIDGMKSLIASAHQGGMKMWGGTLLPFAGAEASFYTAAGEKKRQQVNAWIVSSGAFDAVVDFDHALRDPAHPDHLLQALDSGDHLHPNDAGYQVMAEAIDVRLLAAPQ